MFYGSKLDNTILWSDINEYSIEFDINNPITIRSSCYASDDFLHNKEQSENDKDISMLEYNNNFTTQYDARNSMDNCLSPNNSNKSIFTEVLSMDLQVNSIRSLKF